MSEQNHRGGGGERTPAEQAAEMAEKAKVAANTVAKRAGYVWSGLSKPEKIMAAGAGAGLLAFFLPWVSAGGEYINGLKAGSQSGYAYLLPLLMAASLVLLYFTQGASNHRKILAARWQIAIGSVGAAVGFIMVALIQVVTGLIGQFMGAFGGLFGGPSIEASAGIGAYLFVAGSAAVIVGAFKLQANLLENRKRD